MHHIRDYRPVTILAIVNVLISLALFSWYYQFSIYPLLYTLFMFSIMMVLMVVSNYIGAWFWYIYSGAHNKKPLLVVMGYLAVVPVVFKLGDLLLLNYGTCEEMFNQIGGGKLTSIQKIPLNRKFESDCPGLSSKELVIHRELPSGEWTNLR